MFEVIKNLFSKGVVEVESVLSGEIEQEKIIYEINKFKFSDKLMSMQLGERYFEGKHDILNKTRQAIGNNGELVDIKNLPNSRVVDNQYKKIVVQKVNYLLGRPILFQMENDAYSSELSKIISKRFIRVINNIAIDTLNCGVGWLYVYYNELGDLSFKRFNPCEIIPVWKDDEHTILDYAIRLFETKVYKNGVENTENMVEVYTAEGIQRYSFNGNRLKKCDPFITPYFALNKGNCTQEYNWARVPIIPFRYNSREIPLIKMVKSLQDGINTIVSNFQDNMQEDARNTIMVLVNYGGENLGEFRQNLATYGAVKVQSEDGVVGDVKTIQVEVNADNYLKLLKLFKDAIIENGMSYNAKDDRLTSNPNQMNIKSMYSDIELDANSMEVEFQTSIESLLWFINIHFDLMGMSDFDSEKVDVIFNRDMMLNESSIISDIKNSVGILSHKTLIEQHPYVTDIGREVERVAKEEFKRQELEMQEREASKESK